MGYKATEVYVAFGKGSATSPTRIWVEQVRCLENTAQLLAVQGRYVPVWKMDGISSALFSLGISFKIQIDVEMLRPELATPPSIIFICRYAAAENLNSNLTESQSHWVVWVGRVHYMAKSKIILKFFWQGFVIISYHLFPLCLAILRYLSCFAFLRARCWTVEPCFIYSGWVNSGFSLQKTTMKLNKGLLTEEPVKPKNKLSLW